MKKLFGSVLAVSVMVFALCLAPPVAYTQTPGTAPFWYGTHDAYKPPLLVMILFFLMMVLLGLRPCHVPAPPLRFLRTYST